MSHRILILGATGMLGHKLWQLYRWQFDTWVTMRGRPDDYAFGELFDPQRTIEGVDAFDFTSVVAAIEATRPDVVVNCIGVVKQSAAAKELNTCLMINAFLPHRLASVCRAAGIRLIHISTDCVFSGRKVGLYTESDPFDAEDLYGSSKYLGEVCEPGCLTLRTSIIGRELNSRQGLIEWFLSNDGRIVSGYTHAIFSGLTTLALGQVIAQVMSNHPSLSGLYHVAATPINKYELLSLVKHILNRSITIVPNSSVIINRALDGRRFQNATGITIPDWSSMIREMAADLTPYERWRGSQ